jgi:hypothetical protein
MLFIPIGTFYMLSVSKKYLTFAIGFGLVIGAIAYSELGFKFIPQPDNKSIHLDIYGWDKIMSRANRHIIDTQTQAIGVTNWTLASRALYYNRDYNSTVYLIDKREDQFDIWEDSKKIGRDLLIINTKRFDKDISKYMSCDSVTLVDEFDIVLNKYKVNSLMLYNCKNFQGLK